MGRKENQLRRRRALIGGNFIKPLKAMDFTVPQRVFGFIVGLGNHQLQIILAQDRRAKQLVAVRNARTGFGQNVTFEYAKQAFEDFLIGFAI